MKIEIPTHTKALLLDLGGVILNLEMNKLFAAFDALGFKNFDQHFDSYSGSPFIEAFEEGKLSNEAFIQILIDHCHAGTTQQEVLDAWNALLGDLPIEKFTQVKKWSQQYDLYLYSNTNALHVAYLHEYYNKVFGENEFQNLFKKIYYSHELGIRKPSEKGYLHIMQEQQLAPSDIFYLEDGKMHFATAQRLGIAGQLWVQNAAFD